MVSLLGMLLIGLAFISGLGIGAAVVVTVTLVPIGAHAAARPCSALPATGRDREGSLPGPIAASFDRHSASGVGRSGSTSAPDRCPSTILTLIRASSPVSVPRQ
ncbi:MAG: hypothetical protein R2710_12800 [Acidimicrobiales bacterium]